MTIRKCLFILLATAAPALAEPVKITLLGVGDVYNFVGSGGQGGFAKLKPLSVDAKVEALPIHASYRIDPTADSVEVVVRSALAFTGSGKKLPKKDH